MIGNTVLLIILLGIKDKWRAAIYRSLFNTEQGGFWIVPHLLWLIPVLTPSLLWLSHSVTMTTSWGTVLQMHRLTWDIDNKIWSLILWHALLMLVFFCNERDRITSFYSVCGVSLQHSIMAFLAELTHAATKTQII